MYQSKYYTCEEIDERLLKGYYDDVVSKGYTGTLEQFQLELAYIGTIEPGAQVNHTLVLDGDESDLDVSDDDGNVIARFKDGHIQTQKFNSRNIGNPDLFDSSKAYAVGDYATYGNLFYKFTAEHTGEWNADDVEYITIMEYVKEMVSKVEHPVSITDGGDFDLDISDEQGNVIARFSGGEFQTKNFDSMKTPAQMDDNGAADFQIADEFGNIIAEFKEGNFRTKNFDSTKGTGGGAKVVKDDQDRNILILSRGAVINGKLYL